MYVLVRHDVGFEARCRLGHPARGYDPPTQYANDERSLMKKVNLKETFATFDETWVPKIVGELNGQFVKVVNFLGEYVWHHHENEDELFLVLKGSMKIELRDKTIELEEGEFIIVPKGVEHKPVAPVLAHVLLFEPNSTRNTGDVDHDYTIEPENLDKI